MIEDKGVVSTSNTSKTEQFFISTVPGSFKPTEAFRKELIEAGWTPPQQKALCRQCGKEIRKVNDIWMHVDGIYRHLATPKR